MTMGNDLGRKATKRTKQTILQNYKRGWDATMINESTTIVLPPLEKIAADAIGDKFIYWPHCPPRFCCC